VTTLGVDYGEKRIGVAVAHTWLAEPVGVIANNPQALAKINRWAKQHGAELIIIGVANQSQKLGTKLKQLGWRVEWHDETLTSQEAAAKLQHKSRQFRSQPQDAYQAAVMLQDWLDSQPATPAPLAGATNRA
jgi:RNase H-fold protein (predicted Holliday junction resolvase)